MRACWFLLLAACASDYSLMSLLSPVEVPPAAEEAPEVHGGVQAARPYTVVLPPPDVEDPAVRLRRQRAEDLVAVVQGRPVLREVPPDPVVSSAVQAWEDPSGDVRRERFVIGTTTRTPVADFLFVVDNSVSMEKIISQVAAAFQALAEENPFPEGARIGVMTTMPADPGDLYAAHPAVVRPLNQAWEPGFLALVDREHIASYRQKMPSLADRFPAVGCAAWFGPFDTGTDRVPCLVAHTQTVRSGVGVEAGLTAVSQLLQAAEGRPVFRPGAAVNLIFVSDTHDPGLAASNPFFAGLVEQRPTAWQLVAQVLAGQQVASFRIHAIAPATQCGERWRHIGPVYFEAAKATGGLVRDMCSTTDYASLIREIAETGPKMTEPVLSLGAPMGDSAVVRAGGVRIGYVPAPDRRSIRLDHALPRAATEDAEVTYLRADAVRWTRAPAVDVSPASGPAGTSPGTKVVAPSPPLVVPKAAPRR